MRRGYPNKRPRFNSEAELRYFERTPKHVLFSICQDYAMRDVGEEHSINNRALILDSIKETERKGKNLIKRVEVKP